MSGLSHKVEPRVKQIGPFFSFTSAKTKNEGQWRDDRATPGRDDGTKHAPTRLVRDVDVVDGVRTAGQVLSQVRELS